MMGGDRVRIERGKIIGKYPEPDDLSEMLKKLIDIITE